MLEKQGKCTNFGNCGTADLGRIVSKSLTEEFLCSDCGKELIEIRKKSFDPRLIVIAIGLSVFLAGLGGIAWYKLKRNVIDSVADLSSSQQPSKKPEISAQKLASSLEQGNFGDAQQMLQTGSASSSEAKQMASVMNKTVSPEVKFQFQKAGKPPSPLYPADQLQNMKLTHKDNYRFQVEIPPENPSLYLFIFQKDPYGKVDRIFPNREYNRMGNPLQPGQRYRFPENSEDWLYLSELSSDTGQAAETVYIIASPWKAEDVNALFGKIHQESAPAEQERLIREFVHRLKLRAGANLQSVFYKEISFNHVRYE